MERKTVVGFLTVLLIVLIFGFYLSISRDSSRSTKTPGTVKLDVPYISQRKMGCSEASTAMVLEYYGYDASQKLVKEEIGKFFEELLPGLKEYLPKSHYASMNLESLKKEIDEKNPVIIRIIMPGGLHTVVVVGYGKSGSIIYIHDPAKTEYIGVSREILLNRWISSNFKLPSRNYESIGSESFSNFWRNMENGYLAIITK
ncbi:hypothetical protein AKJ64_02225 [candidate division MSBL1 archaeon SCGC-AAA259E17]|uniref:Peptidase C39-like domain-containing protein n=1 Tax=candidate division MSBL1 archaeon SCGC-AAA259E17 TaxID=1698263 RepID=A0A133UF35_9EURY|nr:hypothetical protein AKJ64_02225 [candidate division MSBL1 archaeon SCGC-AAA259E17]